MWRPLRGNSKGDLFYFHEMASTIHRGSADLDRFTNSIPPGMIGLHLLRLRSLLLPRISSGDILRSQAERGNIDWS